MSETVKDATGAVSCALSARVAGQLIEVLRLPANVVALDLVFRPDQPVRVRCEILPPAEAMDMLVKLVREYRLQAVPVDACDAPVPDPAIDLPAHG